MGPKLIKTIEDVKTNVPVNMTSTFSVVSPFLANAETQYVARLIGQAQFDALVTLFDGSTGTNAQKTAIAAAQKVACNLGYFFAIPVLSVGIGTTGITVTSGQDTKQAFQWQVIELKNALQEIGFTGIEELLTCMESNLADFSYYDTSAERSIQKQCLITTAIDFNDFFEINRSRMVFQAISYIMRRIEMQLVSKTIGADYLQALKVSGISQKQKDLVKYYLKPGIALLTIAKAAIERIITLQNGQVTYNFRGRTDNLQESQVLTNQQLKDATDQLTADGNQFLQDGLQFILANPDDFVDFVLPVARRRFKVTNTPCSGLFGV